MVGIVAEVRTSEKYLIFHSSDLTVPQGNIFCQMPKKFFFHKLTLGHNFSGISASFAVKMFKAWIAEKDANSVTSSLRKANLDKRLLVRKNKAQQVLQQKDYHSVICFLGSSE